MAAFDLPFVSDLMSSSTPAKTHSRNPSYASASVTSSVEKDDHLTVAAFSPSSSHSPLDTRPQRSSILIRQKSPLLVATPPQITRALAYSYPFIRPLNKLVGLLSWTDNDPWESFLLVAAFWAVTLYGDVVTRWAGPVTIIMMLMLAMYARRYSALSSSGWTGEKRKTSHKRGNSEASMMQHNSLEDVVENLRLFTSRCNILLDPFLKLTDFLSTQTSATSATTRPALTAMFIRILLVTPLWILMTLPPFYIITTKRIVLAVGTTILTWHSQPARVTRTIFWRSRSFRRICAVLTGLDLADRVDSAGRRSSVTGSSRTPHDIAAALASKSGRGTPGIRFTFTIYENQRRWLGIGWTSSLLAYERSSWTDEHLNTTPPKDKYELPAVEGGHAKWHWVDGSEWHVANSDGDAVSDSDGSKSDAGWVYYDNKVSSSLNISIIITKCLKWQNGRNGKDGWNKYTRRRKWCRTAELVEIETGANVSNADMMETPYKEDNSTTTTLVDRTPESSYHSDATSTVTATGAKDDGTTSLKKRKGWFGRRASQSESVKSTALSGNSTRSLIEEEDDYHVPLQMKEGDKNPTASWGMADDAEMSFG
jgi:hypothetical protein